MENLEKEFLAWFAGFWEGEGWISTRNVNWPGSCRAELGIKQKDKTPLELIKSRFGGTIKLEVNKRRFPIWRWEVRKRSEVIRILQIMFPHLRFRQEHVKAKLELLTRLQEKYPKWTRKRIITKLRVEAEKLGRSPAVKDAPYPLVSAAKKHFGSWNCAKEAAGLQVYSWGVAGKNRDKNGRLLPQGIMEGVL